jgi:hypothetical protein
MTAFVFGYGSYEKKMEFEVLVKKALELAFVFFL